MDVLVRLAKDSVVFPNTELAWDKVLIRFESVAGFPAVGDEIDGSLFEIECPADFEGCYCRKGYPALNVQVVVDHKKRF
jgi:hypothetical protein